MEARERVGQMREVVRVRHQAASAVSAQASRVVEEAQRAVEQANRELQTAQAELGVVGRMNELVQAATRASDMDEVELRRLVHRFASTGHLAATRLREDLAAVDPWWNEGLPSEGGELS